MEELGRQKLVSTEVLKNHQFYASLFNDSALGSLVGLLVDMQPGDRLPSERELTQQLSISRNTLRDRIGKLESIGVLTRKERQGTFYSGLQAEQAGSVLILGLMFHQMTFESLISVRHALERQAAIEACRNATPEALGAIAAAIESMQSTEDGHGLLVADWAFHKALFTASASPALLFFSQMLHGVLQGTLRHLTLERDFRTMRRVHADVLRAVEARDAEAATVAIDAHFEWLRELRERELADEL
ncbi:FadR/GntR family transcriptional regulator [Leucobacter ruminantium]|uniref:FadR family transcriptional regulator n=1 Tax=Leucobacter ruminantium TaxID=1289170 RepID=A0A939RXN0_9MICO|nr:FCD domain-containing protein [Leucobacter ruminantium]MBO1804036.1 FadR family transcriptional regulator [Leucobacter ruminantium]